MSLELRARVAMAAMQLAFNPDQRRGPDGRWIKMGGKGSAGKSGPAVGRAPRAKKTSGAVPQPRAARLLAELDQAGKAANERVYLEDDELPPEIKKLAEDLFSFEDPQTGLKTNISRIWGVGKKPPGPDGRDTGSSIIDVVTEIQDASGKKVGIAHRKIMPSRDGDKLQVFHVSFKLDSAVQGGGFSSRWLREAEQRYKAEGIDQIALTAADKVGGYAWTKAGFDFDPAHRSAEDVAKRMEKTLRALKKTGALTPEVAEQGKDLARRARSDDPDDHPTPMEFAMLGWKPGATTWAGKQTMLGAVWEGVKEL